MDTDATASIAPELDPTLDALARGQHGALTTRQLLGAGVSEGGMLHLVASRVLEHPGRGLYLVRAQVGRDASSRQHALASGAMLLYPDSVLAGETALLAHGVAVWGSPMTRPAILRPISRSGGMSAFWVRPSRGESVDTDWGPAMPVAAALAQHALDHGLEPGLVSADDALHREKASHGQLVAAVGAVAGTRHGSRAVAVLRHADGRRESVGESRTALAMALGGLDVEPQVVVHDSRGRFVARADFGVRGTKVLIEFDGRVKYADGDPSVLWEEKKREDRLRRLGYVVVRVTWAHLERPGLVAAMVWSAVSGRATPVSA